MRGKTFIYGILSTLSFIFMLQGANTAEKGPKSSFHQKIGAKVRGDSSELKKTSKSENLGTGLAAVVNLNTLLHAIVENKSPSIKGGCQPEMNHEKNQNFINKTGGRLDVIIEPCFKRLYGAVFSLYKAKSKLASLRFSPFCKNPAKLASFIVDYYQVHTGLASPMESSSSLEAEKKNKIQRNFFKVKDCFQSMRNSLEKKTSSPSKAAYKAERAQDLNKTLKELRLY